MFLLWYFETIGQLNHHYCDYLPPSKRQSCWTQHALKCFLNYSYCYHCFVVLRAFVSAHFKCLRCALNPYFSSIACGWTLRCLQCSNHGLLVHRGLWMHNRPISTGKIILARGWHYLVIQNHSYYPFARSLFSFDWSIMLELLGGRDQCLSMLSSGDSEGRCSLSSRYLCLFKRSN